MIEYEREIGGDEEIIEWALLQNADHAVAANGQVEAFSIAETDNSIFWDDLQRYWLSNIVKIICNLMRGREPINCLYDKLSWWMFVLRQTPLDIEGGGKCLCRVWVPYIYTY